MSDKGYRRVVWAVRALNLAMLPVMAVIFFADIGSGTRLVLGIAVTVAAAGGLAYLLLTLRGLRIAKGGPDTIWVDEELRQFLRDFWFRWRSPRPPSSPRSSGP